MKIIMPLFDFCGGEIGTFRFSYPGLSLDKLRHDHIPALPGLSEIEIEQIKHEQWAFVYQVDSKENSDSYKDFVNILLLAFRIFSEHRSPFIKYFICKEETQNSGRILAPMKYIVKTKPFIPFNQESLEAIDEGFKHLQEMYNISPRTKNALYSLSKAYTFENMSKSFVMMMIVLESLFSKDEPPYNDTKKTICKRTSSLLKGQTQCTKEDIEELYNLRCDIVHGRIEFNGKQTENLQKLEHLEFVLIQSIRKLTKHNYYKNFDTPENRNKFMIELDEKDH